MNRLSPTIVHWIETGKLTAALAGEGEYFMPDHTYRSSQNVLLIVQTLILWGNASGQRERAAREFVGSLVTLGKSDPLKSLIALLAYGIKSRSPKRSLPCDFEVVDSTLAQALRERAANQSVDFEQLKRLVANVHEVLPVLPRTRDAMEATQ